MGNKATEGKDEQLRPKIGEFWMNRNGALLLFTANDAVGPMMPGEGYYETYDVGRASVSILNPDEAMGAIQDGDLVRVESVEMQKILTTVCRKAIKSKLEDAARVARAADIMGVPRPKGLGGEPR